MSDYNWLEKVGDKDVVPDERRERADDDYAWVNALFRDHVPEPKQKPTSPK